jgi:hypothetical protein
VIHFELELTSESMNTLTHFGRTPWTGDRPIARPILTYAGQLNKEKHEHKSISRAGCGPTTPLFGAP